MGFVFSVFANCAFWSVAGCYFTTTFLMLVRPYGGSERFDWDVSSRDISSTCENWSCMSALGRDAGAAGYAAF